MGLFRKVGRVVRAVRSHVRKSGLAKQRSYYRKEFRKSKHHRLS